MDYKTIILAVRDGVAHLTLNRPDAANAINLELSQELYDAALRCDEDPAVRAVLQLPADEEAWLREFWNRRVHLLLLLSLRA
jgi:enoyl-CoA hydratase/carnithine racemase